jgi:flavin-dependent thymidylate synthase
MKIILAGYNLDSDVIESLKKSSPSREDITPETLSASYARISRDPRPIDELRQVARQEVERARRSNRTIIFKMGHHSVAEHAVFNFDIIGVSRLAIEEIEKFRLCSYTEKSQRYITLQGDYVLPEEVKQAGMVDLFRKTIKAQNNLYRKLYQKLRAYVFEQYPELAANPKKHSLLEGRAKEDARYIVSLATQGQLGMTLNARNLELLVRRFASKKLTEVREVGRQMYELAHRVAPSIILFTEANDYDALTYDRIKEKVAALVPDITSAPEEEVRLVDGTPEGDEKLLAVLIHRSKPISYEEALRQVRQLPQIAREELIKTACQYMEFYDPALREWEVVDLTFECVVSATCFAQLKRHRMATLITQPYEPSLGVTIPPAIEAVGGQDDFLRVIDQTNRAFSKLSQEMEYGAEYILTNAHRRRVLLKVNARELYHISRLREDATSQWDIRRLVSRMREEASRRYPLTFLLLGGKDSFPELYRQIYGRSPKFFPPST